MALPQARNPVGRCSGLLRRSCWRGWLFVAVQQRTRARVVIRGTHPGRHAHDEGLQRTFRFAHQPQISFFLRRRWPGVAMPASRWPECQERR